jgi:WD40 repeat protein
MSSIFLSHSSQDNEAAADLARRLKEHGYDSLFLDFDPDSGIKAGRDWERELYRNLKLAGAVVVLCSPHSMGSRWCFVEIAQAKALGKPIFPVTMSPCRVESILNDRQVIDLAALGADEAYRRLFDGLRAAGLDPWDSFHWDPKRPPFPGFHYFEAEDAGIYFGREGEVRQVIEALTRMQRQAEPRLLVVVGSSGSGKSSLVRAGVLPRLSKDRPRWALVDSFRPGAEPLSELARALASAFPDGPDRPGWRAIRDRLQDESRAADPGEGPAAPTASVLTEYADDLTMLLGRREASVLLVVDQAEELLQGANGDEPSAFLRVLRRAAERRGGRVFGLLALRSDFLGSFQNHAALRGAAFVALPLGPLPVESFPQVIEGPADRAALALEPGLVPSMIADARTDDALPLLAFTLREMYERRRDQGRLSLRVYRDDLGGIRGAVARVVERIKAEAAWTPDVGRALRRAFLKLVRVNDEGQFIRQPSRWADLPDLAAPVLEAFVKARLLNSDGDVVEVTHESLFRVWPELAGWLDEGRELMLWKKTIRDDLNDWIAHERSPLYLLSGARVAEGRRWLASHADDFPGPEGEFIAASIAAEDARIARERAQQEKLRWLARVLAVSTAVASVVGIYALIERNRANVKTEAAENAEEKAKTQAKIATSRRLAALSVAERPRHFDCSLLLAVEAVRSENTFEARESLYNALQDRPKLTSLLQSDEGCIENVAFSSNGKTIAAGYYKCREGDSDGGGVVLWDVAARKRLSDEPLSVSEGSVYSVAFSPDGMTIAAGYHSKREGDSGGGVVLWDVTTSKRLVEEPLSVSEGSVYKVAFSPDGKIIAVGYRDFHSDLGGVALWDAGTKKRLVNAPLPVSEGGVVDVAFSPDSKIIAAGYNIPNVIADDVTGLRVPTRKSIHPRAGGVVLWDVATRKRVREASLSVREGGIRSLAFSPDGKTIVAGYGIGNFIGDLEVFAGGVVLWDVAAYKREVEEPLSMKERGVDSVSFSPDGKTVGAAYDDGVAFWDVAARKRVADKPLLGNGGEVEKVSFSPDGKTIAASCFGGVGLWDMAASNRLVEEPLSLKKGAVVRVCYSPDGKKIAAGYVGGVALWDVAARKQVVCTPLSVRNGLVLSVSFSPDSKTIAAGYSSSDLAAAGSGVELWDVASCKRLGESPLSVREGFIRSVSFGTDGNIIAAGYAAPDLLDGGGVVLWDVAARKRLVAEPLGVREGGVESVSISPDGKTIAAGYDSVSRNGGGVALWDVKTGKRLVDKPLTVPEGGVVSISFSSDGRTIAAGFTNHFASGGVVLWDVAARKRLSGTPLPVREGEVDSVSFGPDGKTITAGFNKGIVLWDVAARKRIVNGPLPVEDCGDDQVISRSVSFSPDGKTIASGYWGANKVAGLMLLDVDLESWQRRAGQIANRNFTWGEWREYFPDEPYRALFPDRLVPPEVTPNLTASKTVSHR